MPSEVESTVRIAARSAHSDYGERLERFRRKAEARRGHRLSPELLDRLIVTQTKQRIHAAVRMAVKTGILSERPCEQCNETGRTKAGRSGVVAHHDDYNSPFRLRWLCWKCHRNWHLRNRAEPPNPAIIGLTIPEYWRIGLATLKGEHNRREVT